MHNRTVPLVHNSRRYFGKFTSCTTFGGHKLVSSKPFLDCTKFYNCCQRYIATCGKNSYRCTSTFSALNYCGGIFFKFFSYLYEVVRTNFSVDFWNFRNFRPQFGELRGESLPKNGKFRLWGPRTHPVHRLVLNFRMDKRTHVPLGRAEFDIKRCNYSPLWGENADFGL